MVVCPADTRVPATNFIVLQNQNVSYLVGLNAAPNLPNSILEGDRNLTNDYSGATSVLRLGPGAGLRWTRELHVFKGNLLFADGRVEESNTPRVAGAGIQMAGTDLSLPNVLPPQRPGGATAAITPSPTAGIASARPVAAADGPPWMPRSMNSTVPTKPGASMTAADQSTQPLTPSPKLASASSNPSAWLLPKEQAPDPGFSLFPSSMSLLPKALVRKSVWPLWLLLVLLVAGLLTRFKWLGNRED
jgi:prepilin-type processing-associated H-X9-DG protein